MLRKEIKNNKKKMTGVLPIAFMSFFLSALFFSFSYTSALTTKSATPTNLPSNGLVLHHTFDGKRMTTSTSTDSSTRGNNGTLFGSPRAVVGKVGQALSFNGSNSYVAASSSSSLNVGNQFTLAAWVYVSSSTATSIISKQYTSPPLPYALGFGFNTGSSTQLQFGFYDSGGTWRLVSMVGVFPSRKWVHVTGTWDGTTMLLYIDGVLNVSATPGGIAANSGSSVYIGRRHDSFFGQEYFNGSIDDARIYNRALSAKEVAQLAGVKITNKSTILTRPLSYYTFDEVAGNALDSGSAKRNLVMTASRTRGKLGRALSTDVGPNYQAMATTSLTVTGWFFINGSGQHADIRLYQNPGEYGSSQFALGRFYCGIACEDIKIGFSRVYHGPEDDQRGASTTVTSLFYSSSFNNRWHHFAGTYSNASGWEFYLDGTLMATSSDTGMIGLASPQLQFVGVTPSLPIDEVRIYDKKLNASEILNIYNTTKGVSQSFGVMATSSLPVSNGLVAHWTLDGKTISTTGATTSAQDLIGGFSGAFTNMSTTTSRVLGKLGQAITFDGADDRIYVGTSSQLANKPFSVSFWAKSNVPTALYDSPIGKVNTGSWSQGWGFYTNDTSDMRFFVEGYSTNQAIFSNLNPRVWHHYVGVWDGTNIYIYVDGVRGDITDTYTGTMTTSHGMYIGSIENSSFYNWNGPIDDVRVYNRGLTQEEVRTLYRMGGN